jgi:hypothetical protein
VWVFGVLKALCLLPLARLGEFRPRIRRPYTDTAIKIRQNTATARNRYGRKMNKV